MFKRSVWLGLWLAAVGGGCSGNTDNAKACQPGDTLICLCADGAHSSQTCNGDGKSFAPCACADHGGVAGTQGGVAAIGGSSGNAGNAGSGGNSGGAAAVGGSAGGDGGVLAADGGGDASIQPLGDVVTDPNDDAAYLFDQTQVRTYDIQIAASDLATINQDPSSETYVPAMLTFEGKTSGPYAIRYKGSYGAFLAPCTQGQPGTPKVGKCSMKLSFNEANPDTRFYGLKKLNFHSMIHDDSMMRDRLGYAMFRESGIVAPRAVHARVLINGKLEGLFAVVEEVDGRFTRAHFTDGGQGNLYKEVWPMFTDASTYTAALQTNEDQNPSVQGMLDFKAAIDTSAAMTEMMFDRAYMMKYVAIDRVIINDDGVFHWWCITAGQGNNPGGIGNHNYYWYQATARERFWLIPWDFDNAFNASDYVTVSPAWNATAACQCMVTADFGQQRPASCDPLTKHFIEWMTDYDMNVDNFIAGAFAASNVNAKLDGWTAQITAAATEAAGVNSAPSVATWQTGVSSLKTVIDGARTNRGYLY